MDLRGRGCEDLSLPCKIRAAFCFRATRRHPDPHVENEHASVFPQRHDLSCPQVDDAWHVLREDHVMTCFLESVHTDQCSRHWSDFEYTLLHGAQIGPPVDGYFAFLLDLISSYECPRFSSSSLLLSSAAFFSCSSHTLQHRCRRQPLLFSDGLQSTERSISVVFVCVDSSSLTVLSLDVLELSLCPSSLCIFFLMYLKSLILQR